MNYYSESYRVKQECKHRLTAAQYNGEKRCQRGEQQTQICF